MADTLLAYLVPKLTKQVENAATDALVFILSRSVACRDALDSLLRDDVFRPESIIYVKSQVTGDDGARPDLVGYDRCRAKRLLVESKFWAGLQEDQATRYLEQLEPIGPGVLMFVAPTTRMESLWAEIRRQMESGPGKVNLEEIENAGWIRKARIVGLEKRLMLVSWDQLLRVLSNAVASDAYLTSDIEQLRGLARHQDDEEFQPIHVEEFGLAMPRRIRDLNRLIDDVVQNRDWMISGNAASQKEGYGRYFKLKFQSVARRTP